MTPDTTLSQVVDNIDNWLACIRCGEVTTDARLILTQLPTTRGCVGFAVSFLCADCTVTDPSAADDLIRIFKTADHTITDQCCWRKR